jgi:fructose-bisphosphate aldolase class II
MAQDTKSYQIFGDKYTQYLRKAQEEGYALPAVNVFSNSSVNAALEAAKMVNSDVIIQISSGGASFFAGQGLGDELKGQIAGAVAFAKYTKEMAKIYEVNVIIHSDHANKSLLPWVEGMLLEGEKYYAEYGEPLFSSHMLDWSEEPMEANLAKCKELLPRMKQIGMTLELEIGITGGEEDGVNNEDADESKLYTKPEEVDYVYESLNGLGNFTVAAAFGNVHGVYKPGNVHLKPSILQQSQEFITKKYSLEDTHPIYFVFHGGSGSTKEDITAAVNYGVVKMNIDTDTQFAYAKPVRDYVLTNEDRMARQVGSKANPEEPNKKVIDPRKWLRKGEEGFRDRLVEAYKDLGSVGKKI